MKWILAVLAAMGIAALVFLQMHSVKTTYVNGLAPYTSLPGLEFIVERDCYIFKFKEHDTDWPLLGAVDTVPDLPAEVKDCECRRGIPQGSHPRRGPCGRPLPDRVRAPGCEPLRNPGHL